MLRYTLWYTTLRYAIRYDMQYFYLLRYMVVELCDATLSSKAHIYIYIYIYICKCSTQNVQYIYWTFCKCTVKPVPKIIYEIHEINAFIQIFIRSQIQRTLLFVFQCRVRCHAMSKNLNLLLRSFYLFSCISYFNNASVYLVTAYELAILKRWSVRTVTITVISCYTES